MLPPEAADALRARLAVERPGLVLLEGHPGCGTAGAVAALEQADPLGLGLDRYAAVGRVAVAPGEVGQSGLSVARLVLRLAERALGRRPGSTASDLRDILQDNGPLRGLLREVEAADRRLLLGLQDLQHGREPYRGEPLSVVQVYEALVGSAVDVVATTVPAGLERTLFDERLVVPVAEHPDPAEVTAWVRTLCAGEPMRRRVLRQLAGAAGPQDLFEVCEGLERWGGEAVFEPEVERALWDLRPLLGWDRAEVERDGGERQRVRTWYLFSDVVAAALDADAGADGGVGS